MTLGPPHELHAGCRPDCDQTRRWWPKGEPGRKWVVLAAGLIAMLPIRASAGHSLSAGVVCGLRSGGDAARKNVRLPGRFIFVTLL